MKECWKKRNVKSRKGKRKRNKMMSGKLATIEIKIINLMTEEKIRKAEKRE